MTIVGALLCIAILCFAAGAAHGWLAGWTAAAHGWLARVVKRAEAEQGSPGDLDNMIRDRQREVGDRLRNPTDKKD